MSTEDREVYLLAESDGEDGWVTPTPARTAVVEALRETTDLSDADVDDIDAYLDREDLRSLLDGGEGSISFEVEGHAVNVDSGGTLSVEE